MKCEKLVDRVNIPLNVDYEDIFKSVEKQKQILKVYKELLRVREILLNTSHQDNDGPDARVHQDNHQEDSVAANNFDSTVINDVIINVVKLEIYIYLDIMFRSTFMISVFEIFMDENDNYWTK